MSADRIKAPAATTADRIRAFAEAQKLTQEDLAVIASVTPRTVQNWLSGRLRAPRALLLLIRAVEEGRITLRWVAHAVAEESKKPPPP